MPDDLLGEGTALSILFEYDGLSIQIADQTWIDQPAPETQDVGPLDGQPGFWYELRDEQGAVAWRRGAPWPIRFEIELPPDESDENAGWVPEPAPSGAFVALVPLLPTSPILALVGSPPPGLPEGPVADIAVFDLGISQ